MFGHLVPTGARFEHTFPPRYQQQLWPYLGNNSSNVISQCSIESAYITEANFRNIYIQ